MRDNQTVYVYIPKQNEASNMRGEALHITVVLVPNTDVICASKVFCPTRDIIPPSELPQLSAGTVSELGENPIGTQGHTTKLTSTFEIEMTSWY